MTESTKESLVAFGTLLCFIVVGVLIGGVYFGSITVGKVFTRQADTIHGGTNIVCGYGIFFNQGLNTEDLNWFFRVRREYCEDMIEVQDILEKEEDK